MGYIKAMIFTFIISIVIGSLLVYAQSEKDYETKIEFKDYDTNEYIEKFELRTFPKNKRVYNEELTGVGRVIFSTELYTPVLVTVKSEGYKTKRGFYLWNATKENIIFLQKEKKDEPEEVISKEEEKPKPEKVDLIPKLDEVKK